MHSVQNEFSFCEKIPVWWKDSWGTNLPEHFLPVSGDVLGLVHESPHAIREYKSCP